MEKHCLPSKPLLWLSLLLFSLKPPVKSRNEAKLSTKKVREDAKLPFWFRWKNASHSKPSFGWFCSLQNHPFSKSRKFIRTVSNVLLVGTERWCKISLKFKQCFPQQILLWFSSLGKWTSGIGEEEKGGVDSSSTIKRPYDKLPFSGATMFNSERALINLR